MGVVLLVRHGQASFGAADYDKLSPLGAAQAVTLGASLAASGVSPERIVAGSMLRHRETATGACEGAGWSLPTSIDPRWNEFDHEQVLSVHGVPDDPAQGLERRAFQHWFDVATRRWSSGSAESDYTESFRSFTERVQAAFVDIAVDSRETSIVFTSGGVIAWLATWLVEGGPAQWHAFNNVMVNSSVTKVIVGRSGRSMVSFNDHHHLAASALTYR